MSQVGSPPSTARPAPAAPAVTGAAVTPTPTDQATGNAPRHQGGGQPAPQQQPPPQAPAPPAPAVTLAGALTALFSGQPAKATVEGTANGQVILRLPEAQLLIAAEAIEAARGDVLVLKLATSTPNPAIIVTGRNGRAIADPTPVPVIIEPVAEQPAALMPSLQRRPMQPAALPAVLPSTLPPLPGLAVSPVQASSPSPVPLPAAPAPSGEHAPAQPPAAPTKAPVAGPNAPSAPPVLIDADLPPQAVEARPPTPTPAPRHPSLLQQVTQPWRAVLPAAPAAPAAPIAPAAPSTAVASAEPQPVPIHESPMMPRLPVARATTTTSPQSPAPTEASAEPDAPGPLRPPVPAVVSTSDATAARLPSREQSEPAPIPTLPRPIRRSTERPVPFVPPAIPADALRSPIPHSPVAIRAAPPPSPAPAPLPSSAHAQPESARMTQDARPAAAAPTAPAKPTAATPSAPTELVPIEVEPLPPPDAPLDRRAASAWTALWATARMDPVAAERIRDMLQPKPGGRLGGGLAFLVSALRAGKLADWLGADESARVDRPSRPTGLRTVDAEFRDLARMVQERGPDGWRATPLAVLDGGAVQPVMLYVHRPPRRRKNDPKAGEASERFMLDLKLSRAGPMRIDGLLRPKALDVIVRTERPVPSRIQRDLRQVFTISLEGAGLGGTLAFQKVDRLPPPPSMTADSKPHHAVLA